MHSKQKRSKSLPIVFSVIILVIVSTAGWFVWKLNKSSDNPTKTTTSTTTDTASQANPNNEKSAPNSDPYKGFKAHANTIYSFSFKYPTTLILEEGNRLDYGADQLKTEAFVNLKFNVPEKYSEAYTVTLHDLPRPELVALHEKNAKQSATATVNHAEQLINGRPVLILTITHSNSSDISKRYLFAVENKTYAVQSINESLNLDRSKTYWEDFTKIAESFAFN